MLVQDLDTPCAVVDLDVMENNLRRCQTYLDRHGLSLRPHIKTHKIPEFAHLQIKLGAKGVNCQKLGEAEVMVDAGIADILLTYNLIGQTKLDRLVALARRSDIKVVADSKEVVEGLSSAMSRAGLELPVLVECDTGAQRCGVTSPADAVTLAQAIDRAPGLKFKGLMTYPPKNSVAKTNAWLSEAADLCKRSGLSVATVSNGGTPDLYSAHEVTIATEHRPGNLHLQRPQPCRDPWATARWPTARCGFRREWCRTRRRIVASSTPGRKVCRPICSDSRATVASSSISTGRSMA